MSKKQEPLFFEYTKYTFKPKQRTIGFYYRIGFKNQKPLEFVETIFLPKTPNAGRILPKLLLDNVLQSVHLMLGISYYKLYCPSKIILPYRLSKQQADFWNTVYRKGLGEFFYRNKLSLKRAPKFPFDKDVVPMPIEFPRKSRDLVGIGGGKDSIVAAELLRAHKQPITAFVVETQQGSKVIDAVIAKLGVSSLRIRRVLDPKIFKTYPESYNGHIPISAVIAFLGLLSAVLYDYEHVTVANEHSSNFGNVKYEGQEINHQWSKSAEFEQLMHRYIQTYITSSVGYVSVLRQFTELRIAKLFVKYPKYFSLFSSCNKNFKVYQKRGDSLWCGECPKCAFTFLLFAAVLPKQEVLKIFGKNLFADKHLIPLYQDLLGFGSIKPFDCVGDFDEAKAALVLAASQFPKEVVVTTLRKRITEPERYVEESLELKPAPGLLAPLKLMGVRNVLLLGYGKEGKVSEKYLHKFFPEMPVGVADQSVRDDYLSLQQQYDIAIKTPGIPKRMVTIPYVTATNLFFGSVQNLVIGVTGSKGKSTTASLIYAMLEAGGLKVKLLGNIGKPALEYVLGKPNTNEILVMELSSYQSDDIAHSPQIAVVTNLFPEHMTYHGSETDYYEAKRNIIRFQTSSDCLVFNELDRKLVQWAKTAPGMAVPYSGQGLPKSMTSKLLGDHNRDNIAAAATVARMLGVNQSTIKRVLKEFQPLPHRLQNIGTFRGITFFDDAISTTPESTIMALRAIPKVKTIFLGGEDRGYKFVQLEKELRAQKVENIVLFPDSGRRILKSKKGFRVLEAMNMKEAVEFALEHTPKGAVCLLSCASPSYSLWKNFEEKGDEFQKWVRKMGANKQ